MAKSFKIATNEFIQQTLGGKLNPNKTLKDPLKCPTYGELKEGVNFVYTDGTTLGIQWRGTVNGEDYTDEYDSDRCLAEIDIEKLSSHDFRIYTNSGLTETTMSADCMTTAEDISGKTRYEADRLNENFLYPTYSQTGDVKWHEFDDSNEQKTVTVNLSAHGSWTTYSKNPDSTLYNAYMSNSSNGKNNAYDLMVIGIPTGFTEFTIYIRSYAEDSYDYTIAGKIDTAIPNSNIDYNDGRVKSTTSGNQKAGTAIGDYTIVEYTNIDSTKEHTIWVMYRKDGSKNSDDDRGYVLIPKSKNNDYVIAEGVGSLKTANVKHSRVVPISACTLTYSGGDGKPIHERWDIGGKEYTLSGKYKGLTSQNDVTISQSGETYGYYADRAHTQWVSANTLSGSSNSPWYPYGKYGYDLENSSLENFYSNLQKQFGWLNDFGDNSGTTNGRDEYNMDSTNYSSGTSLTWGGSTVGNIVNAQKNFYDSDIMGETISTDETKTYHMAFSNDMWYSGNTVPTEINDKHNFYWIFLDESVTHNSSFYCYQESQRLRGDEDTSNDNYSIEYERTYFKPLHCYGKTSIDRMYKYGTTIYDKGTTSMNWLQGKYPKHFKRVVLQTVANIYPYDYYYSTEINKLKLNSHVIVLESQNNSTYSASTRVKATSGQSKTYTTSAQAYDKEYKFYPRFIMMSPEQYSADTNGAFGQIVSGQELSYNEHQTGDTYDYNIKKDNNAIITKEKLKEPFVSYKSVFTSGTTCSTTWPYRIFYYPKIYHFEAKKDVTNGKCYYKLYREKSFAYIDEVKDLIENTLTEDEWTNLSEHTGYIEDNTYGYLSNATQYQSGTANGISFTNESTQQGRDDYGNAYTSYTYTLTSDTTIDEYVSSPGTILKINYEQGDSIETQVLESTGTTINVNTQIDTGRLISSIEYTAITNYEYAIYGVTSTSVSVKYATFKGLNFYAYDPIDVSDVPVYSIPKKDGVTDFTGNTTVGSYDKNYKTGEIELIDEIDRELNVYLKNKNGYGFTYKINANNAYKYNDYNEFIHNMITNYSYMKSINEDTYWVSDAWDDNKKYVSFSD